MKAQNVGGLSKYQRTKRETHKRNTATIRKAWSVKAGLILPPMFAAALRRQEGAQLGLGLDRLKPLYNFARHLMKNSQPHAQE